MSRSMLGPARLESLYTGALRLYPAWFRAAYAEPMRQALRDALADPSVSRRKLIPLVLRDLATSLIKEHFAMLRETYSRPALLFNALVLAAISTVLALALYVIPQQVLRRSADDSQLQLAGDVAERLESGSAPSDAIPAAKVDMVRSLSPFVIVYDDQGRPMASQGLLDGVVPIPPAGVFDYARAHGEDRPTWSPRRGLRFATVVRRVGGAQPGFVLAGRSLSQVQANIEAIKQMAALAWVAMLALIAIGTLAFGWMTRGKPVATTV